MSNRFDDDDLEDYANDDYYDDDEITPEDEEKIDALLPVIKSELKDHVGYTDQDLKETLWNNYLELEPTLVELKKRFKQKKISVQPIVQKPKAEGKPLSKIAALAKARASERAQKVDSESNDSNKGTTSISILNKLKTSIDKGSPQVKPNVNPVPKPGLTNGSKLSGLAALRNNKLGNTSSLDRFKSSRSNSQEKKFEIKIKEESPIPDSKPLTKTQPSFKIIDVTFEKSPFQHTSKSKLTELWLHQTSTSFSKTNYKRKFDDDHLNIPFYPYSNTEIVKKVKTNFSNPSPDDVILTAQKNAFDENAKAKEEELSKKVSNLNISKSTKVTKPKLKINLDDELSKKAKKPNTSFVVIGHVDAGKSTLTGRLLLDQNVVDKNTYTKLKREAEKAGKGSFSLAWVMDQTGEERSRGVTIDICSSQFETDVANFTIVDAPGHRDFVPNMITGVAQADIAVLVVDSSTDAFESGFNLDGQTKEHTILARSLGINKVIVAVNKMDNNDWSEERFEEIKGQLTVFLKQIGFSQNQVQFVPCSGLTGLNISHKPQSSDDVKKLQWYNGDSLLGALEKSDKFDRDYLKPFVLSISDIDTSSFEFTGRVDTGTIQPGETVIFAPSGETGMVDSLTVNSIKSNVAIAGDTTTLKIKDVNIDDIQLGDIVSIVNNEIPSVSQFEAKLVLFELKRPLLIGTQFIIFRGNVQQPAKIVKIISLIDKLTGQTLKKKPKHLSANQSALVEIELINRPLPLQLFKDNKQLGRVVLRKDGDTIGAAVIEKF